MCARRIFLSSAFENVSGTRCVLSFLFFSLSLVVFFLLFFLLPSFFFWNIFGQSNLRIFVSLPFLSSFFFLENEDERQQSDIFHRSDIRITVHGSSRDWAGG